jgi:hypothetical protein
MKKIYYLSLLVVIIGINSCVASEKSNKNNTKNINKTESNVKIDEGFEKMKAELFQKKDFGYVIPIYADPPTDDYQEFKDNKFPFQISKDKIKILDEYRDKLRPFIMKNINENDSWVYLATYFKYKELVPILKEKIVKCDKFYGWEGPDYSKIETYLNDAMYPHQSAYIEAIKYITKKSIEDSLSLSETELSEIKKKAALCVSTNKDSLEIPCCNKRLIENILKK